MFEGKAGVLSPAPTEAKNSSRVSRSPLQLIWSALLKSEKAIDNNVKD